VIFVPQNAPKAKLTQLLIFGAKVIAVKGSYDDAYELSLEATKKFNWYCRSTGYNPYTREGKKTVALEICEQLNWLLPDYVFVPVGDGNIISGVYKGFYDFLMLGLIDEIPKIVGVQSEKSNAIYRAWENYKETKKIEIKPVDATTIADSISVNFPRDGVSAVYSIIASNGFMVEVSDEEIIEAMGEIARNEGIFPEPAGATSFAGLKKALKQNLLDPNSTIVCLITGSGLKDIESAGKIKFNYITIGKETSELERINV
jgi:threonine synthase